MPTCAAARSTTVAAIATSASDPMTDAIPPANNSRNPNPPGTKPINAANT